jgi:hypothetical protein
MFLYVTAPVTNIGEGRVFMENISYEHMYDSRKDPNYPIRAKVSARLE